jgi:hypothetical protein
MLDAPPYQAISTKITSTSIAASALPNRETNMGDHLESHVETFFVICRPC